MNKPFTLIIGNPPYGTAAHIAVKFLNKAGELTDDIRYVLPLSFKKVSISNRIRLDLINIEERVLPSDTFPRGISTVLQHWIKTDKIREKTKTFTTHPDFEFVKYKDKDRTSVFIGSEGYTAGRVKLDGWQHYTKQSHHFIVCSPEVVSNFQSIESKLVEVSRIRNGIPGVCKDDIIRTYIKHFGRGKIHTHTTHPDFEFVKKGDPNTNVFVMRSGNAGRVLLEGYDDYEYSHYFIKAQDQHVIDNLLSIESKLVELGKVSNGMGKLSKHELITCYIERC